MGLKRLRKIKKIMKDLYRILEVTNNASREVIDAAYKALCKKNKNKNNDKLLSLLNESYNTLKDEKLKSEYDNSLLINCKKIGQYKIISKIGEGGFGTTYKGEHLILGTPVCIKHASSISSQDEEIMKDEAKAMWDLRHWAIPSLREIIKLDDGSFAIVMSFINGITLEKLLEKGPIDYEHVCWITERVINALCYLHDNGIVHGDVKPQNIIVQADTHQVSLVDYGLSMIRPKISSVNKGYTPYYASPEQIKGMPLIPESDFYSLGMTMIFAFSGEVESKSIPDDIPSEIVSFIKKLIVHDPLKRPNWEKENLCKSISDIRQSVFGRRYSDMKPLKV